MEKQATMHVQQNLDAYVKGLINAGECQVLITKLFTNAWEEVSSNVDLIFCSFRKCGISVAIDGSEDEDINVEGLEDYSVKSDNIDCEATTDEESDNEDLFADLD